jgi:IQ calmodulin-binding motif
LQVLRLNHYKAEVMLKEMEEKHREETAWKASHLEREQLAKLQVIQDEAHQSSRLRAAIRIQAAWRGYKVG